jgi:hypothetical protein
MRCASFYFERSCPEQRPRAALKPQEPHSSGPWTPGAPAEVLASRGSWGRGRGFVASCKSYLLSLSHKGWLAMSSGIKRCAFGRQCVITRCPFPASLWQRPTRKQAAKRARTEIEIAGGQPRTSVPQLPLRRNARPPGRGPLGIADCALGKRLRRSQLASRLRSRQPS